MIDWNKGLRLTKAVSQDQWPVTLVHTDSVCPAKNRLVCWKNSDQQLVYAFVNENGMLLMTLHNGKISTNDTIFIENVSLNDHVLMIRPKHDPDAEWKIVKFGKNYINPNPGSKFQPKEFLEKYVSDFVMNEYRIVKMF